MKYLRIFSLCLQHVFEYRARAFIYFLMSLINPIILIFYWQSTNSSGNNQTGWNISEINSYYLLLIIATGILIAHIEEEVGIIDIKEGRLTQFLLRPFPYYAIKFIDESSFRLLRGFYSITAIILISVFMNVLITVTHQPEIFFMSIVVAILAYILSFTFKITIALIAFWITDIWGIFEIIDVAIIVLAGNIMPLEFFPIWLKNIAMTLPFSYMTYFPIIAFQGKLEISQILQVIFIQLIWIGSLIVIYKILWTNGIKKFTGIGQ